MISTTNQTQSAHQLFHTHVEEGSFSHLFPRFIQLTPEFKIVLDENTFKMTEQTKQQRMMVKMPISGELEGGLIAYLDPSRFNAREVNIITGVFCESVNILAGHFLTRIDQEEDLMCSLHLPVIYGVDNRKEHNYDFLKALETNGAEIYSFELKGKLENHNQSAELLIQVFLMRKGVK